MNIEVIYAVWKKNSSKKRVLLIYDFAPGSWQRKGSAHQNWFELERRTVTATELAEIQCLECKRNYLVFSYDSINSLLLDELKYGITMPAQLVCKFLQKL